MHIFSEGLMLLVDGPVYMNGTRVLDSGNLRVHWLLRRRQCVLRFYKIGGIEKRAVSVKSAFEV